MNIYRIFDENNVSMLYPSDSASAARKDFKSARPNEHIKNIKLVG